MGSPLLFALLSSAITSAANYGISQQQKNYNEQMQDKQNEYNLPINQVQRLKEAGINPNAVAMGNSGIITGNTSAPINPYTTPDLADPLGVASNSFLRLAQGKTEDQLREVRKQEAEANVQLMFANAEKLGVESEYQGILNSFAAARESAAIEESTQRSKLYGAERGKFQYEIKELAYRIKNILPEELNKIISERNLNVCRLDEVLALIANYEADTALKGVQAENVSANTDVQVTQAALNVEERGKVAEESSQVRPLAEGLLSQYQATVNKLVAETGKTEQEVCYYLYELYAKYYKTGLQGIPIPGQGMYGAAQIREDIKKGIGK